MKWQLTEPHHIDEQVLQPGTIIGDDTQWPYLAPKDDPKIKRKKGDHLPPSRAMIPMDDEAHKYYAEYFGGEVPESDPTKSIPLTGAPGAPKISGPGVKPPAESPKPVNTAPKDDAPKTGMLHDSAKNPGDSKDTQTAKTPDIKKL
jgi:hypothetical protein